MFTQTTISIIKHYPTLCSLAKESIVSLRMNDKERTIIPKCGYFISNNAATFFIKIKIV